MKKLLLFSLMLAAMCALGILPAYAQLAGATLSGTVRDDKGEPLPGTTVTAKNTETGFSRSDITTDIGTYRIPSLPFGIYDITAQIQGFATQLQKGVRLDVGRTVTIDFSMKLSATGETIEVIGETPLIERTESHVTTVVTPEQVHNLPINSRQFGSLAALAPGTTLQQHPDPTRPSNLAVSLIGGSGRNLNVQVDGGDNNDDTVGGINEFYSLEGVEEFNFLAEQYKAEYGRSAGGVMNVVTKSGTNDPHGTFFFGFRDDSLNALTTTEKDSGLKDPSPYSRKQYGGSIGGPIVKDKAHFFVAIERSDQETQDILSDAVIALSGLADRNVSVPTKDTLFTGKFTSNINPKQYLTVRYGQQKTTTVYGTGTYTAPSARGTLTNTFHSILASHNYVISENKLNEFVFQYADFKDAILADSTDPAEIFSNGVYLGQNLSTPQTTQQKKYQFKDDFSWSMGANHHFKTGVNFVHEPKLGGTFSIGEVPGFYYHGADRASHIDLIRQFGGNSTQNTPNNQYGLYFQDDWNANQKLTLNLGVRYDYVSGYDYDQSVNPLYHALAQLPFDFPWLRPVKENPSGKLKNDKNNIAPRIGAAYDWNGDGKMVCRGGWGRFYDYPYLNANILFVKQLFGDLAHPYGVVYSVSGNPIKNPDGSFFQVGDPLPPSQGSEFPLPDEAVSPDFAVPYSDQASVGFSRQLNPESALDVDYVHVAVRDQYMRFRIGNADPSNPNDILAGTPFASVFARFWYNGGFSNYNGLSVSYRRRLTKGIQFQGAYTLSKVTGDTRPGSNEFSLASPSVCRDCTNNFKLGPKLDPKMNGPLVTDARHRLVLAGIFDLPKDFRISGVFRANSARPFNAFVTTDPNGDGFHYDIVDATFDSQRGDTFSQVDLRVNKIFHVKNVNIEGIFEVYNLFNAKNPAGAKAGFNDRGHIEDKNLANFGQPTVFAGDIGDGQGEQRLAQIGFRIQF